MNIWYKIQPRHGSPTPEVFWKTEVWKSLREEISYSTYFSNAEEDSENKQLPERLHKAGQQYHDRPEHYTKYQHKGAWPCVCQSCQWESCQDIDYCKCWPCGKKNKKQKQKNKLQYSLDPLLTWKESLKWRVWLIWPMTVKTALENLRKRSPSL